MTRFSFVLLLGGLVWTFWGLQRLRMLTFPFPFACDNGSPTGTHVQLSSGYRFNCWPRTMRLTLRNRWVFPYLGTGTFCN